MIFPSKPSFSPWIFHVMASPSPQVKAVKAKVKAAKTARRYWGKPNKTAIISRILMGY
jgi:hypothetical protein